MLVLPVYSRESARGDATSTYSRPVARATCCFLRSTRRLLFASRPTQTSPRAWAAASPLAAHTRTTTSTCINATAGNTASPSVPRSSSLGRGMSHFALSLSASSPLCIHSLRSAAPAAASALPPGADAPPFGGCTRCTSPAASEPEAVLAPSPATPASASSPAALSPATVPSRAILVAAPVPSIAVLVLCFCGKCLHPQAFQASARGTRLSRRHEHQHLHQHPRPHEHQHLHCPEHPARRNVSCRPVFVLCAASGYPPPSASALNTLSSVGSPLANTNTSTHPAPSGPIPTASQHLLLSVPPAA
ncbi:hypothetical protein MSAN_00877100 [Mycena sanguinolenta]|uniref:Uncharacterized protein n=1 Tax=Mycena sanguinolenta TaxID=230812 RepID=A0A8H7DAB8_9AGAR|nr:hypothetical protein MSAN_00877100 [Mycena sanguinolenta]